MKQQFARLAEITSSKNKAGRYPVSPATWWRWVASGYAPAAVRLGPNTTAWSLTSLEAFDKKVAAGGQPYDANVVSVAPPAGKPVRHRQGKHADLAAV